MGMMALSTNRLSSRARTRSLFASGWQYLLSSPAWPHTLLQTGRLAC